MLTLARQFGALTKNTVLEAVRNKLLYGVLLFALLVLASTGVFGALSLHQEERVFNDLVLAFSTIFLAGLATYQGVRAMHKEMETRTIFTVISKPISRSIFIIGKYLGSLAALGLALAIIVALKVGAAAIVGFELTPQLGWAYYAVFLQLTIVVAVAIFFSSFSSPLLSGLLTLGVFVGGSLTPQLREAIAYFAEQQNPARYVAEGALWVLPDLEKLNLSFELTHDIAVPASYLLVATGYAATYAGVVLLLACLIFERREFS
jgi:ABC-type transport system involved in multi-copper enzyme maturation permease subunit